MNRGFYLENGYIESITFKEYYGMPGGGHEHDLIYSLSIYDAFWLNFPRKKMYWEKRSLYHVWM